MQFNLIKEILTGAITGYITNALAIKMIFREYGIGKLKVGGVVVKTRDEFIENVSSLVEREIINYDTLNGVLEEEAFKTSLEKLVEDLLNIHIYNNTDNLSLGELEGFSSTVNKTGEYIKASVTEHLPEVFNTISQKLNLKDLFGEKQLKHISGELFNLLLDKLNNSEFIEEAIEDFYEENKSLSFGEIFESKLTDAIGENFKENTKGLHLELKDKFDNDIHKLLENTIDTLEIDKILKALEEKILEKRIVDFANDKDSSQLGIKLREGIKDFLLSQEGKTLSNTISKELLNLLRSIDKPVFQMFSGSLAENIESFFNDKLQYVIKEIILWIEDNKKDIEGLIEAAIDDTIDSMDGSLKKNVMGLVKEKFLNNIGEKFDIVAKLTEYLEENTDKDWIARDLTVKITKYIKEENISAIIKDLEKKNVLTEEGLSNFITYNLTNYIDYIPEDYFSRLLNKKLKDIFSIDLIGIFERQVKAPLVSAIKDKYIYTENITKLVAEEGIRSLEKVTTSTFQQLLTTETVALGSEKIKTLLIEGLNSNKDNTVEGIYRELNKAIGSHSLHSGLDEKLKSSLLEEAAKRIEVSTDKLLEEGKGLKFREITESVNSIKDINGNLSAFIHSSLKDNLENILQGNIKKTVAINLSNLKDEELQVMVEEFMGKEMKPITVIGAVLGAIAGIGTYFFNGAILQYNQITAVTISVIVYAIVGWLTNVQALAMLFKPYNEKRFLGIKIPFTPGVIVSRKPRFAKSMGNFIEEELLNKKSIEALFDKNRAGIKTTFADGISKDDYKIIGDFLYNHHQLIGDKGYQYGKKLINKNRSKISSSLSCAVGEFTFEKVDFSKIKAVAEKESFERIKAFDETIAFKLNEILKSEDKIVKVIPKELMKIIESGLKGKTEDIINLLSTYIDDEDKKAQLINSLSERYEEIGDKSLRNLLSEKELTNLRVALNRFIINKMTSEDSREKAVKWLESLVSREFASDKKIGQVLNGFVVKLLEDNFSYIVDKTVRSLIKGIANNQQVIAEVAISTTKENLNFFEIMGYNMLGGDEIISNVVDNLVNDKLPAYIEAKKGELGRVLVEFIDNKIFNSSVDQLGISLQHSELTAVIDRFINDKDKILGLSSSLIMVADSIFNWITKVKVQQCLKALSISNIEDLAYVFKEEGNFIQKELKDSVNRNKAALAEEYSSCLYKIFEDLILSKKVNLFTKGIDDSYAEDTAKRIGSLLYNSDGLKKNLGGFIDSFTEEKLRKKNLGQLLDLVEFNNSIETSLVRLMEDEQLNKEVREILISIVSDITANNLEIIDIDTKEAVVDILMNSALDSLKYNLADILNNVHFRSIAERQINNMEPREIEDLFNSFAKKYFDRLKLYGLWGGIFGLHWLIGIIGVVAYAGSAAKDSLKE